MQPKKTVLKPNGEIDLQLSQPFADYMTRQLNLEYNYIEDFSKEELARFADADGFFTKSFQVAVKNKRFKEVNIISTFAKYESDNGDFPAIQIRIVDDKSYSMYYSPVYEIGSRVEFYRREWRVPPIYDSCDIIHMSFIIPDGTKLNLRDIMVKHNYSSYREKDIGIRYHGHAGATAALGFQVTAEMGFTTCITIPKFTKDGIGVCVHDDETVRKELRLDDGSIIPEGSEFDKPVCEFTYEELLKLNAWRNRGDVFHGVRAPKMEDYFRICSNTGMQPTFSVHPPLSRDEWLYVRHLLIKYRLLEHFRVKSHQQETLQLCREIFDDEIAGYIIIQGARDDWRVDDFAKEAGLDKKRHNVVAEFFHHRATDERIKQTLADGYPVSIAAMRGGVGGPRMQELIDLGVSEFTLDHHCSMGLSW